MAGYYDPEEMLRELNEGDGAHDFYTLLNVERDADQEEIRRAYRRLCRIYHPDRYQDERKQKTATEFFRKIQEAYKVLGDPRMRGIYDKRGLTGLSEDMAIVERTSLPTELMDEYEKLRKLWEERSYIQKCNPRGKFAMEVNATPLVDGRDRFGRRSVSVSKYAAEQSVQAQITKSDTGEITGGVTTMGGGGFGNNSQQLLGMLRVSLLHLSSADQNWLKGSLWLGNAPGLSLECYRNLPGDMYLIGHSTVQWVGGGVLRFGATAGLHRRLDPATSGAIIVRDMGAAVSVKLTRQLSPNTTVTGEVTVGQTASHVGAKVMYNPLPDYFLQAGVKAGTEGLSVLYGIKYNLDKITTVGSTVYVGPEEGVAVKLKLERASMSFAVKLHLSEFVGVAALFYATSLPLVLYGCVRSLAVLPLLRSQWLQDVKEKKSSRVKELQEKRRNAEAAVELMQETLERVVSAERAKHGLLIVEAWYGKLFDDETDDGSNGNGVGSDPLEAKVIDVRIPLQCMVSDSKLILRETGKANIPGFYDPCVGERKYLRTRYEFHGLSHEVTVENSEPLVIPRMSHRVMTPAEP